MHVSCRTPSSTSDQSNSNTSSASSGPHSHPIPNPNAGIDGKRLRDPCSAPRSGPGNGNTVDPDAVTTTDDDDLIDDDNVLADLEGQQVHNFNSFNDLIIDYASLKVILAKIKDCFKISIQKKLTSKEALYPTYVVLWYIRYPFFLQEDLPK